jgi:hypothetical protein
MRSPREAGASGSVVRSVRFTAMVMEVKTISAPITSSVSPSHRQPDCRIRKADVFVSIFSQRALMNFGWTLACC